MGAADSHDPLRIGSCSTECDGDWSDCESDASNDGRASPCRGMTITNDVWTRTQKNQSKLSCVTIRHDDHQNVTIETKEDDQDVTATGEVL